MGSYFQSVKFGGAPKNTTVWKGVSFGIGVSGKFTVKTPFIKLDVQQLFEIKDMVISQSQTKYGLVFGNDFIPPAKNRKQRNIVAVFAVFYLVAPYLLKLRFWLFSKPRIEVSYATEVSGQITGSEMNRQYYLYYLDGNTETSYDFNAFVPDSASTHTGNLTQEEVNRLILGTQLQKGDYISKAAKSVALSVRRGNNTTQWHCSPVEALSQ
ncbi:hypothetical protein [Hymenobacter terrenus]|uniref:hypothetical protein n=1 Tax=Hymenobacter terrenus TaxID=1629124 RepID=UPI0012E05709|nr:hypothetical protein [Hymenobacter terrenus]